MSPSKTETNVKFSFTRNDIQASILADLEDQGYKIESKIWNETGTKFEVTAARPEIKQKGGK